MLIRHILDSIVVSPYVHGKHRDRCWHGAGLPGLPLAICNPDKEFVLLDSLGTRISFIRQVVHELKHDQCHACTLRGCQDYDSKKRF